jgi:hypothetical protein
MISLLFWALAMMPLLWLLETLARAINEKIQRPLVSIVLASILISIPCYLMLPEERKTLVPFLCLYNIASTAVRGKLPGDDDDDDKGGGKKGREPVAKKSSDQSFGEWVRAWLPQPSMAS